MFTGLIYMSNPAACSICGERDHKSGQCPELNKDLQSGFYKPAGGMPRGDEEDDSLNRTRCSPLFTIFIENNTCSYCNIQRTQNPVLTNTQNRCIQTL